MANGDEGDRVIYQSALEYAAAEADQAWAKFNAMLLAHTILIAVSVGLIFGEMRTTAPPLIPVILLISGLVVCFVWLAATERALRYQDRYVAFARRLEDRFPIHQRFLTDGAGTPMSFPASLRTRHGMRVVISVFALLYAAALARLLVVYMWYQANAAGYS
jgi:hypothetical protein